MPFDKILVFCPFCGQNVEVDAVGEDEGHVEIKYTLSRGHRAQPTKRVDRKCPKCQKTFYVTVNMVEEKES